MAEREPPDDTDDRAGADKPGAGPSADRPAADRPAADRPTGERPPGERPSSERGGRFRRLGRRMMGDNEGGDREGRTILGDAKDVLGAVLEGGDKAKSEVVRAVAREVRNYLDELGLKDDLHRLVTNYSLEVHASINLRQLAEGEKGPREDKAVEAKARPEAKGD